jgi:hypothetical protein
MSLFFRGFEKKGEKKNEEGKGRRKDIEGRIKNFTAL